MKMKNLTKVKTTTVKTFELDRVDILDYLTEKGYIKPSDKFDSLDIFVKIPGGGDWSNTNLEIDNICPIFVEIKTTEEK